MSDEPTRPGHPAGVTPAGIDEHWCEHAGCTKWGGWGFSGPREASHWFCFEHRADGEAHR
jgi:hypothetical protein